MLGGVGGWTAGFQRAALLHNFALECQYLLETPLKRRGSGDKRRISLAGASQVVPVEDYRGRPQRYRQITGLM